MKNSGRNTAHQRKIYLTVLIIIIILAAVFVGVYYLWKQTKTESEMKVSGQAERSQTQNDADTIEYQGSTYKYNDHLSEVLLDDFRVIIGLTAKSLGYNKVIWLKDWIDPDETNIHCITQQQPTCIL